MSMKFSIPTGSVFAFLKHLAGRRIEAKHTSTAYQAVEHIAENGKDGGSGVNAPVDSDAEGAYASLQTPRRLGKQRGKGNRQHRDATNGMGASAARNGLLQLI